MAAPNPILESDPESIQNLILDLKRRVAALEQSFVSANAADELVSELGDLDFRAVDDEGRLRMIMSAINLLEEFGISAHYIGFDTDGTPQVWDSADDGSRYAGGGNVRMSRDGVTIEAED
ncbi:MAG: hypothetical protein EHM35_21495, partial [Planctomycetaceae bacterium]